MSLSEYKKLIALPADSHLNIFFANWTNPDLLGIATFPWVRDVHSVMGKLYCNCMYEECIVYINLDLCVYFLSSFICPLICLYTNYLSFTLYYHLFSYFSYGGGGLQHLSKSGLP